MQVAQTLSDFGQSTQAFPAFDPGRARQRIAASARAMTRAPLTLGRARSASPNGLIRVGIFVSIGQHDTGVSRAGDASVAMQQRAKLNARKHGGARRTRRFGTGSSRPGDAQLNAVSITAPGLCTQSGPPLGGLSDIEGTTLGGSTSHGCCRGSGAHGPSNLAPCQQSRSPPTRFQRHQRDKQRPMRRRDRDPRSRWK
jgi:hypothetical protein